MRGPGVEQGRQHPADPQLGVGQTLHVVDGVEQLPDTAMRQGLALQRDDHLVRRRQPVDRQDSERGRTVDQDEVVALVDLGEREP